jgi:hypothetical protein
MRRIPQEYFAEYGEYADQHEIEPFSVEKQKSSLDPKTTSRICRIGIIE